MTEEETAQLVADARQTYLAFRMDLARTRGASSMARSRSRNIRARSHALVAEARALRVYMARHPSEITTN